ncbi:HNH endonuclease [Streptosporangium subroseum]|uniref:HNH endonuclease n=1 Tax=Streptosporangium subroseum TaxID=106412 RepID=UPI00308FC860|nr:HNH endonuclease [Streptosporangium subroseum]
MTIITVDGGELADLVSYPPDERPVELATRAELSTDGLRISPEKMPEAWLAWPCAGQNGYFHLPLYRREDASPADIRLQPIDYVSMHDEARFWAGEVLSFGSMAVVAVKASDCCGRVVDVAVMDESDRTLFNEQLECPCRETTGPRFVDIAKKLLGLMFWDDSPTRRNILIGWSTAGALALTTELRLLADYPNYWFWLWGKNSIGIEWEDAQVWDAYWRGDWTSGDNRQFALGHSKAIEECCVVLDRLRRIKRVDRAKRPQWDLPVAGPMAEGDSPVLLPVRLGRENFQKRRDQAEYWCLCERAEGREISGSSDRLNADVIQHRGRSSSARRAVLLRSEGKCENPDCENPGRPSDISIAGGPILDVDHIDDYAKGGRDHPELMIALCPNCHAVKTRGRSREILREKLRKIAYERHLAWQSHLVER